MQILSEKSFDTGAVEINYAEGSPSGPPLVLLHGFPGRWQEFLPILPVLILQWHIYALDFRGQGKSGRVPGQYQSKYHTEDAEIFLQQQLDEPAFIFGQSAGGMVALHLAALHPELVRGVIVGDSPIDMEGLIRWMTSEGFKHYFSSLRELAGSDHPISELMNKIANIPVQIPGEDKLIRFSDGPGIDMIQIRGMAAMLSRLDPGVLDYHAEGHAREFLEGFDLEQILRRIVCPVFLLQANPAKGGMMTDKSVSLVQSILPEAAHTLIDSAGHDLGLDTWEVAPLLRAVTSFLGSL